VPGYVKENGDCLFASLAAFAYCSSSDFDKDSTGIDDSAAVMRSVLVQEVIKEFQFFQIWTACTSVGRNRVLQGEFEPEPFEDAKLYEENMSQSGYQGGPSEIFAFVEKFKIPVTVLWRRGGGLEIQRRYALNDSNVKKVIEQKGPRRYLLFSGPISGGHFQPMWTPPLPRFQQRPPMSPPSRIKVRPGALSLNGQKQGERSKPAPKEIENQKKVEENEKEQGGRAKPTQKKIEKQKKVEENEKKQGGRAKPTQKKIENRRKLKRTKKKQEGRARPTQKKIEKQKKS